MTNEEIADELLSNFSFLTDSSAPQSQVGALVAGAGGAVRGRAPSLSLRPALLTLFRTNWFQ